MKEKADLLLLNGCIFTVDSAGLVCEAMAIRDGKILKTGQTAGILAEYSSSDTFDLKGKPVYPGFIDAHCHFAGFARNLQYADLTGARSFEEVIERLRLFKPVLPGGWITGRGWDQNLWDKKQFPDRERLDQIYPDRPVVLIRIDGHVVLANSVALKLAGIGPGHNFNRDEVEVVRNRMTGILKENAADHMRSVVPAPGPEVMTMLLKKAEEICLSQGLTGVSDAGLDYEAVSLLDTLHQKGVLHLNIYAMLEPTGQNITAFIRKGIKQTSSITIRSIKIYADGSLGSRTALLKKPYSDDPSTAGLLVTPADSIRSLCELALEHNYQVNTHAIGDSANKIILDIYASFLKGKNDLRWRIEHAQVVDPADIHLFRDYSVIPSIQATHATSDMGWAESRLGPVRIAGAYAYKDLLAQNGWLANGTDFPIEKVSPLLTFHASVSRQDVSGAPKGGFRMNNGLTREEALRSMTIWAAKANFWEDEKGSLEKGKAADFIILEKDIMKIPIGDVPFVRVLKTYIGGECLYGK